MSFTQNMLHPLGAGQPMPGAGGAKPISLRGPTQPQMQRMVAQPPQAGGGLAMPAPPARSSGGVGDLPASFTDSRNTLMQEHGRAKAVFKDTGEQLRKLDAIRKGLERLSDKQDMVTMEDVIGEAGKLVSHGIDPVALAGLLADAPQQGGGEALGGWVASHAQTAAQGEQNLMQFHEVARGQVITSALHLMMAHANAQNLTGQPVPIGRVPEGNELTPGTDDGGPVEHPSQMGHRFIGGQG